MNKRPTKRVVFKTDTNLWADVYANVTYGDRKYISKMSKDSDPVDIADKWLVLQIAEWNVTDDNGQTLPVSSESLELLDEQDVDVIAGVITPIVVPQAEDKKKEDDLKKNSTKTPQQSSVDKVTD